MQAGLQTDLLCPFPPQNWCAAQGHEDDTITDERFLQFSIQYSKLEVEGCGADPLVISHLLIKNISSIVTKIILHYLFYKFLMGSSNLFPERERGKQAGLGDAQLAGESTG